MSVPKTRLTGKTKHKVISSAKLIAHAVKHNITPSAELERERLTSLINSMADGVIATDEKTKIVLSNGAALNILDVNNTMTGKYIRQVLTVIDKNNQPVDIKRAVLDTKTQFTTRDWRLKYSDDSMINLYLSIAPVRLGYGQEGSKGYVLLLRDITREKSLEEERDEFISVVSHELRTPIAIAEGNISNAQFIVDKSGDAHAVKDALKQAHDQVEFLASMINDLSTLSRAERGKLTVEIEPINAHALTEDLTANYTPQAEAKGLKLLNEIDPQLELLKSSKLYVREILQNFITNAIKYTEKGHISIGAVARDNGVEFRVSDTGIGISKSDQDRVFDKFFRSEDFRTRQTNGTGLGLYVTMKLARIIHADIDLHSELNKGSTFSIFIPNLQ
ncbi:MAG TPA: ATP-binding protein [Candidatus Saccharimonadales bacterium]|nr:ATP-binding protein [Candidatus Saccharimonadales bacterium]